MSISVVSAFFLCPMWSRSELLKREKLILRTVQFVLYRRMWQKLNFSHSLPFSYSPTSLSVRPCTNKHLSLPDSSLNSLPISSTNLYPCANSLPPSSLNVILICVMQHVFTVISSIVASNKIDIFSDTTKSPSINTIKSLASDNDIATIEIGTLLCSVNSFAENNKK